MRGAVAVGKREIFGLDESHQFYGRIVGRSRRRAGVLRLHAGSA